MRRTGRRTVKGVAVAAFVLLSAVCLHSVQEIHYLKSFFPPRFTLVLAVLFTPLRAPLIATVALLLHELAAVVVGVVALVPVCQRRHSAEQQAGGGNG